MFEAQINLVFLLSTLVLGIWSMIVGADGVDPEIWLGVFAILCLPVPIVNLVLLMSGKCVTSRIRDLSVIFNWAFLLVVVIHGLTDPDGPMSYQFLWLAFTMFGAGAAITAAISIRKV